MTDTAPTAALLIIGNEILSGRTQDTNTQNIAERLTNRGIRLIEVRVVPDIKDIIIKTVRELKVKADYLLTTGGIGPTHDDITAESIAEAFGVKLELRAEAKAMLLAHYGNESDLTDARLKMAMIPQGAGLIKNPVSGAPGFIMENVYTMAGVPRIMLSMLDEILAIVRTGPKILSNSVSCTLGESAIAEGLENIQKKYSDVEIGSYPHYRAGALGLSLVLRSIDPVILDTATHEVVAMIRSLGSEPAAVSLQSGK
ncbi:MAG: competence/damage-inducible protein A [Micavibrio aeruginosavorus]|uniref:Competence/damage-inducible protein A n=1 Tax=Micavibrio aeruginosavorus TaxID=349221 RepID=A0A2W5FNJ0_9BACT|nr:MAG: competence/damage-inducible protein A [Micavibrio aeruginosavorus]